MERAQTIRLALGGRRCSCLPMACPVPQSNHCADPPGHVKPCPEGAFGTSAPHPESSKAAIAPRDRPAGLPEPATTNFEGTTRGSWGRRESPSRRAPQPGRRVSVRSAPVVTVRCAGCGISFDLSVRNELEHRRHGLPHRCRCCRMGASPSAAMVARMRGWWLQRYSLGELRSWPPL
jgi:hypothetical protein